MFENLKKHYLQDRENQKAINKFFIENGYCESWCENEKKASDNGLRRYSTETRWNQYTSGKIDREKAVALAVKRMSGAIIPPLMLPQATIQEYLQAMQAGAGMIKKVPPLQVLSIQARQF